MKTVHLYYRSAKSGPSIRRVFDAILPSLAEHCNVSKIVVPCHRSGPLSVIQNLWHCFKHRKADVNHVTGDTYYCILAFPRNSTVLTIHDIGFYENVKGIKRWLKFLMWIYLPVKYAKRVTCISEETKRKLLSSVRTVPAKIAVIPNPVDANFTYTPKDFNQLEPIILHIGTKSNKNLERVIEALKDIPCHLRIIGRLDKTIVEKLKENQNKYSNAFNLSDEEIVQEYKNCDIVSFPSTYEGFGMPIIEGQAVGRIVLTSDIEPMKEVANEAAVLTNPFSIQSIQTGFLTCINRNHLRNNLIIKGLKNAMRFKSDIIAGEYIKIYTQLYKQ